jgi:hypothetical protein
MAATASPISTKLGTSPLWTLDSHTQKKLQDYAERIGDTYLLALADEVIE